MNSGINFNERFFEIIFHLRQWERKKGRELSSA